MTGGREEGDKLEQKQAGELKSSWYGKRPRGGSEESVIWI